MLTFRDRKNRFRTWLRIHYLPVDKSDQFCDHHETYFHDLIDSQLSHNVIKVYHCYHCKFEEVSC